MEDRLGELLRKNCTYIEINLKNGDSFSIHKPNQSEENTLNLDDGYVQWLQISQDGCTYENYIRVDEIAFITGIYNCPTLLEEGEE